MRWRPLRTWALLAAAVIVLALAVGGGGRAAAPRRNLTDAAGLSHESASAGAAEAVLRTEADRVESGFSRHVQSANRLLLLFAAPLGGVALLFLLAPPRSAWVAAGSPSVGRMRRWLALRAPPSPLLVSHTS